MYREHCLEEKFGIVERNPPCLSMDSVRRIFIGSRLPKHDLVLKGERCCGRSGSCSCAHLASNNGGACAVAESGRPNSSRANSSLSLRNQFNKRAERKTRAMLLLGRRSAAAPAKQKNSKKNERHRSPGMHHAAAPSARVAPATREAPTSILLR